MFSSFPDVPSRTKLPLRGGEATPSNNSPQIVFLPSHLTCLIPGCCVQILISGSAWRGWEQLSRRHHLTCPASSGSGPSLASSCRDLRVRNQGIGTKKRYREICISIPALQIGSLIPFFQIPYKCAECLVTKSWSPLCDPVWTVAHQASLPMKFSRQQYLSGFSFPSLGDLPD